MSHITFIGSGISSSFTILHFLDQLKTNKTKKKISITIIDRYSEFYTGIAYGKRSGFCVLLITSLKNFLPQPELEIFIEWLNQNKDWLLEEFLKEGGTLSSEWASKHSEKIKNNDWKDLFIPRRFFGSYINQKVKNKIQESEQLGYVNVDYINAEVLDIQHKNDSYELLLHSKKTLVSEKVVLSVGSLPANYLWKQESLIENNELLFVNNPYKPDLKHVLQKVEKFITKKPAQKCNVLIIGANASGLEMLYKLNDLKEIQTHIDQFTLLSTQGLSPDSVIDEERKKSFSPTYLLSLKDHDRLTADRIASAAYKDLDRADEIKLGAASTVDIISNGFGVLLNKLNTEELKKFACIHGNEIGRRQRCAGYHYSKIIEDLKESGRFKHIAGRFSNIYKNDNGYQLEYLDTKTESNKSLDDPIQIVFNCIGSTKLTKDNIPELLKKMVDKKLCIPNESHIGFDVNDSFETSENLHVIGPLLAGNIFEGKAVWHVEHCGRIIWLSKLLSKKLNDYFFD